MRSISWQGTLPNGVQKRYSGSRKEFSALVCSLAITGIMARARLVDLLPTHPAGSRVKYSRPRTTGMRAGLSSRNQRWWMPWNVLGRLFGATSSKPVIEPWNWQKGAKMGLKQLEKQPLSPARALRVLVRRPEQAFRSAKRSPVRQDRGPLACGAPDRHRGYAL